MKPKSLKIHPNKWNEKQPMKLENKLDKNYSFHMIEQNQWILMDEMTLAKCT
jgi:hypothetical protein